MVLSGFLFGEDLRQIYDLAVLNDPAFQSAKEALKAGEEVEYQGYSVLLPKITINANSGYYDLDIKYKNSSSSLFKSGEQNFNSSGYGASLIWPLLRKDSIDLYRGTKVLLKQAKAGFDSAKQNVVLKSVSLYFDYLLAYENVELLSAQKKSLQNQLESAKLNFKLGNATAIETTEAEARYDLVVAKELVAVQELAVKKDAIEKMIGKEIGVLVEIGDIAGDKIASLPTMDEVKKLLLQNPTLKKAKEQSNFSALEYERSKASFFPTVDLVAQRGKSIAKGSAQGLASDQSSSYVGLAFEFNIFNGGYNLSKTREYLANKNKSEYDYVALRQQSESEALQSYLAVTIGLSQMKAAKKAMESSKLSLESFVIGQKIGLRSSTDMLNAEQAYFEAKKGYSSSKYVLLLAWLKLKAMTNELDESELDIINSMCKR